MLIRIRLSAAPGKRSVSLTGYLLSDKKLEFTFLECNGAGCE